VRAIEKSDYTALHGDYSESIDAVGRAINVLKKQSQDRKQAAFVQVSALQGLNLIPADAKKTIDVFLQQRGGDSEEDLAPEANAYEFQSSGVVDMLQKLQDKFIDERTTIEKNEANSKGAFDLLVQDLDSQMGQADKDRERNAANKAKMLGAKADASGDLKETTAAMGADKKFLADLKSSCTMKAADFESRQHLRTDEIVAIEKAITIISSGAVSGNADKHLPSFFMQKQESALPQLRSALTSQMQQGVTMFLRAQAKRLNSNLLAKIAERSSSDPFGKVKKMIKDLIVRLMEEANEEAEHKGYCDQELATNEQTRKEKTQAVETLHSEIDSLTASTSKLTEDINDLAQQITELDTAMAASTKIRNDEKAKNKETVSDAQAAQAAVAQALIVLREFYAKAAEATALMQEPYQGMGGESGGVIGMLEVIEADFARLEAETNASEASSQKEYETFMTDSKVDKEEKATASEHKENKRQDEAQLLTEKNQDLQGTQKELDAALAYFDKLKPACVDSGVSYEDRVARRKEEVENLQEALKMMNGGD